MNYLILLLNVIIIFEIINKTNYLYLVKSLIGYSQKASKIILNRNIRDYWKEKIIPKYSLMMMKLSISMLFILFTIILIIYLSGIFNSEFLEFIFTIKGVISSFVFAYCYSYFKKTFK